MLGAPSMSCTTADARESEVCADLATPPTGVPADVHRASTCDDAVRNTKPTRKCNSR